MSVGGVSYLGAKTVKLKAVFCSYLDLRGVKNGTF